MIRIMVGLVDIPHLIHMWSIVLVLSQITFQYKNVFLPYVFGLAPPCNSPSLPGGKTGSCTGARTGAL